MTSTLSCPPRLFNRDTFVSEIGVRFLHKSYLQDIFKKWSVTVVYHLSVWVVDETYYMASIFCLRMQRAGFMKSFHIS